MDKKQKKQSVRFREYKADYTHYPFIADNIMMVYTLKDYLRRAVFKINTENVFAKIGSEAFNITNSVTNQITQLKNLAQSSVEQIAQALNISSKGLTPEQLSRAVKDTFNDKIKDLKKDSVNLLQSVMQKIPNYANASSAEINKLLSDKEQALIAAVNALDNIPQIKHIQKESVDRTKNLKNPQTFMSQMLTHKKSDNRKLESILLSNLQKYLTKHFYEGMNSNLAKTYGNPSDAVNEEDIKKWMNTMKIKTEADIRSKFEDSAKSFFQFMKTKIVNYEKELVKILFNKYVQDFAPLKRLIKSNKIQLQNNMNIDNPKEIHKTLKGHSSTKENIHIALGFLFEVSALSLLSFMDLKNKDGSPAVTHYFPLSDQQQLTSDIGATINGINIDFSIKTGEKLFVLGQNFNSKGKSLSNNFLSKRIKIALEDPLIRWLMVNNFSIALNDTSEDSGFFDLVQRLRYEYGRILILDFVLGNLSTAAQLPDSSQDSLPTKVARLKDHFPLFVMSPAGVISSVDMINNMLETIGGSNTYKRLYNKDKKYLSNIDKYYGRLKDLHSYGYSYLTLKGYENGDRDYQYGPRKSTTMGPPYRRKDLREALGIMRTLDTSSKTLFNILISGIDIYAKNSIAEIMKK